MAITKIGERILPMSIELARIVAATIRNSPEGDRDQ